MKICLLSLKRFHSYMNCKWSDLFLCIILRSLNCVYDRFVRHNLKIKLRHRVFIFQHTKYFVLSLYAVYFKVPRSSFCDSLFVVINKDMHRHVFIAHSRSFITLQEKKSQQKLKFFKIFLSLVTFNGLGSQYVCSFLTNLSQ